MAEENRERMMLSLDPETHAALKRFSKATGKPMATFAAEVLQQAMPYLKQLADAAEAAKAKRAEALDMLLAPLAEAQIENAQMSLNLSRSRIKALKRARKKAASQRGPELIGEKPRVRRA